jgi:hypothetical protein
MQVHIGCPTTLNTFRDLVNALPDTEFPHLGRSTVPLLAWWNYASGLSTLADAIGLSLDDGEAWFEYPVSPSCRTCGGRGKSSFTDLMLRLRQNVLAIEAKHNESLYETVAKWLGEPPSENKQRVLRHWVQCCIDPAVDPAQCNHLVYQMVHRTASACHAARHGETPHVVHLLFGSAHVKEYVQAVASLAKAVDSSRRIRFLVVNVPLDNGPEFDAVADEHRRLGADAIREALVESRQIFAFGEPQVTFVP